MNHVSILEALLNIGRGHQQLLSQAISGAYDERRVAFEKASVGECGSGSAPNESGSTQAAPLAATITLHGTNDVALTTKRGWPKGKKRKPRAAKAATKRKVNAKK